MVKRWRSVMSIFLILGLLLNVGVVFSVENNNPDKFSSSSAIGGDSNVPPVVEVIPDISSGRAPLTVHFEGEAYDDGEIVSLEWDFEGDGVFEVAQNVEELQGSLRVATVKNALQKAFTYTNPGIFHALLRVTDDKSESAVSSVTVQVYSDVPRLDIVPSNKEEFTYMAQAGYEAFFGGIENIQFQIGDAWISYQLQNQYFGEITNVKGMPEGNMIKYRNVYPGIDMRYTVYEDLLLEEFIVLQPMSVSVIEQVFTVHGVEYTMHEDGSIGFYNGEDLVFSIPQPVMYELNNPRKKCYGLHYEIVEQGDHFLLKKVIDDQEWLKTAQYPVVIDSSTQGEIADPWEQQGLTPYGQYFKNFNEYVDPLTGHLTIRHTDYSLSGRGLDVAVTRVYSTVVAYKQEEDGSGEFIPVATYKMAPTDLGCGWSLDFPWLEIDDEQPGKYLHMRNGAQVRTQFQNGVWSCDEYGFTMYVNGDNTYTKYRDDGVKEEYDSIGRITSITDLNQNQVTFSYYPYGIASITDTVGRIITFSYSGNKLTSISDGTRTISYNYSGDKLVSVTDPLGRVTSYDYLSENSFLITAVHYPSGGFSSYEYTAVVPSFAKVAPYKSLETDNGEINYYVYKVDSQDTVSWTSPKDLNTVTASAGRPCVFQRDDGSLVMYFKDKYIWTETVWKCVGNECWEETVTHTEWWIKRSISTDQNHWSTPQNVVQVKNTTGNPVVIEKQDGSFVMFYKDKYVWTEENCYWDRRAHEWVCETETHTEYWIYRRTSSDGLIWGSAIKMQKTTLGVRNIAAIQKHDSTFLMCYTDKVGSSYYIRQKTSSDGLSWNSPSNVVLVNSSTGNPALLQRDTGTVYLTYRKGTSIYVLSNAGSGWSSPVQTTAASDGDSALLQTESGIVLIYKGTDGHCYRISSTDDTTWSSPSQIAPNKVISDPATVDRKDRFYRVTAQYLSASALDLVKVTEYSYEGNGYLANSTDVIIRDAQTLQSFIHFEYDSKGRAIERISKDEQGIQTGKIVYTYSNADKVIRQDVYAGTSTDISYSVITGYDNWGNVVYARGPEGAEHFYSYAHTNCENQFVDSKGAPVSLFSNTFYTNSIPSECHTLLVGEAFINNGKVQETYYKYDTHGNMIETKTLFPTRNFAVFSGTFDENGQTTFDIDLTGLTITDGILVISSIAVPTQETLYETHSEAGKGWLNTGIWSGNYFMADYLKCYQGNPPECFDGQTRIGPFEHCPGAPDYTGYTTWVKDNTQYVKTSYTAVINEYPETVEYNLNNSSWTTITSNLGSGTTSTTIPASSFVQGVNTLQFQETNTYTTTFSWTLYIDQSATPQEYINSMTYDSYGNITSFMDALGNITVFEYDPAYCYMILAADALNNTTTATYDFDTGKVTSITDAKGNTTFFEYDLLGRITKKIHPDLTEKEAVYDDQINTVTIYDELDHSIRYDYDCLGRLLKIDYYLSPTTVLTQRYTYDHQNRVKTATSPGGHTSSCEYDSLGRLTKMSNADLTFKEIHYDDITHTVSIFDENQYKKEYHYDWVGNLLWVKEYTDSNYNLTQYTYDGLGNVTSFTDANGNTTSYSYDSLFGITHIRYPDFTAETYSYDALGNVLQKTDVSGTTTFRYNAIYQLIEILYPDHTDTFEYDANSNRTSLTDSAGQTSYTYDSRNRLLSETRTIKENSYTVSYHYDAASRLLSLTYPDQTVITYEYDSLSRLTSIPGYAQFTYNTDLLAAMTYENDIVTTYEYDNRQRLISIHVQEPHTYFLSLNYQYDPVSNITQVINKRRTPDNQWIESTETFQYDWLNRLTSAEGDYGSLSYVYDPVGNRLSQNSVTYTYNAMNELISVSDGTTFAYGNGNRTQKTKGSNKWIYTYDYSNRLTKVEKNDTTVGEYVYDGDGKRIQKTENGTTTTYIYAGLDVLYEETTTGTATYIYGPTGRLAKRTEIQGETHTYYYHADHLGSTRLVTDESRNVVTEAVYSPFGETTATGEYLYNGKEKDATGLYYYGARYYDCDIGRFITKDPLIGKKDNPQSLNRYVYCLNNPVTLIDPAGLAAKMCNVDTGICTRDTVNGWIAYDENGNILSSSDIQEKIDAGDYAEAVILILEFLGYTVKNHTTVTRKEEGAEFEADLLEVSIGDKTVYVFVYGPDDVEKFRPGAVRGDLPAGRAIPSKNIDMKAAVWIHFFDDVNMTAGELFHTVGHEMVHAHHFATGLFNEWKKRWGTQAAVYYSEILAYQWDLAHLYIPSFPGARESFGGHLNGYIHLFIMDTGMSMWEG
jgi:RHS repeat-associated protein